MAKKPLNVLKAGLAALKNQAKTRKTDLLAHLKRRERLSDSDTEWLDNRANHVDEEVVVDTLEKASDYITDINDPFVQKLEAVLVQFGCQTCLDVTCSMEPSYITDYFASQ
ncbi:hypothetical protein BDN71DRAFT_250029 [Pleurotus eryngii]|uniref:Uncharacterized protein n=1 Tax=Pleurotus eryngii TaxID=5323 RepID=A0A9P5ZKQ7_PLEER|nr:hypothetical protein BDN71DRAFT_250029 [Pleurotus eryngii]